MGETSSQLLVTREIVARPDLPRFAVLGDRFQVGVVGQNFSGVDTSGNATLQAEHLVILDPAGRPELRNGSSALAKWTAVASQVQVGTVATTFASAQGQDAVEVPLPVKAFAVPERWAAAGQADPNAGRKVYIAFQCHSRGQRAGLASFAFTGVGAAGRA